MQGAKMHICEGRRGAEAFGKLEFHIYKGFFTHDTETLFTSMDPFVEVKIGINHYWKSSVIEKGGKTPDFGGEGNTINVTVHDPHLMEFSIWDEESMRKNQLIGRCAYDLNKVMKDENYKGSIPITYEGKPAGDLHIKLQFT